MEKDPTESGKLSWLLVRRLLGTTWSIDVKWNFLFFCLFHAFVSVCVVCLCVCVWVGVGVGGGGVK